jgi:GTPase SAR1 family protein
MITGDMKLNIDNKLNKTRNLLRELGNSVSSLVNLSPDIFDDPSIKSCLEEFLTVYQEAVQRLENPSFRIATIGTTSSGKSTIVNALIGRKIAPIEAGEMSGGVLTLKHSPEQKLFIAQTKDAAWDTGEWTGLSDEDLYQRIRTVMHSYHDARKKKEYVAPQITAYLPLLPACDTSLIGLPQGIGVELIDLPGLKSVQDRTNLATIQKQVNKAFSLVALDYMQVDDDHRKRLLEELKKVVEYLQGRTDSMIFILNRVDQRGADDLPLEVRINKLREEIKEVLSLPELPDVLPFNARLLYYAQCAWGSGSFNEPSTVDQQTRLKFLKAMFQDCAGVIKLNTKANKHFKYWFLDIEDQVEDNKPIDDETMRHILRYSLECSGGRELWKRFNVRVQESFSELVILPALVDVFDNYDALSEFLKIQIQTRKIDNQGQVEKERDQVSKIRQNLHKDIKKIGKDFKSEIEELRKGLKSDNPQTLIEIQKKFEKKDRKGFSAIFYAVNEVEGDLTKVLIVPVRDSLKNNHGAFELKDKLREVISPALADDIAKRYDNVSRRISQFSHESKHLVKRVKADDDKGKKELEDDERYVRFLYHTMRQAISARSEFFLQGKTKKFEEALESLVDEQIERLKICLSELAQNLPTLPDKIFEISDTIKTDIKKIKEKIGEKIEDEIHTKIVDVTDIEHYQDGSCFSSTEKRITIRPETQTYIKPVTRDIIAEIEYIELSLPSPDLMAKQWLSGIRKAKDSLWDILLDWILERLDDVSSIFEESVDEITNLAERALQKRSSIIEDNFEQEKQFWHDFESKKDHVTAICQKLEEDYHQI